MPESELRNKKVLNNQLRILNYGLRICVMETFMTEV